MLTEEQPVDNSTEEIVGLPPFEYTGEDLAVKAICEYLYEEQKDAYLQTENSVWIPEFIIYKEVEKDGEYLVFGNFWSANYVQIGEHWYPKATLDGDNCSGAG